MKSYKTLPNISFKHLSFSRRHWTCSSYTSFCRSCSNASKISQNLWKHTVSMTIYYEQSDQLQQNDWNCIGRFTDRLEKLVFSLECCFCISWSLYGTTVNQTCVIVHSTHHIFSSLFGILVANSWIEYFKLFHPTCNFVLSVFQKISDWEYLSIKERSNRRLQKPV